MSNEVQTVFLFSLHDFYSAALNSIIFLKVTPEIVKLLEENKGEAP